MEILIFQHTPEEIPGTLLDWARARGHGARIHHWYRDAAPPAGGADFLVVLGGPMNVNQETEHPWLKTEKEFLRGWLAERKPVLGICLGGQMLAQALGAEIRLSPHREIGFHPVSAQPAAETCAALQRWPRVLRVYQYHEDSFTLAPGCESLLTSPACPHQAFARDARTLGLQFHPESTPAWIEGNASSVTMKPGEPYVQMPEETARLQPTDLRPMTEAFHRLLDDFVAGWQ